MNLPAKDPAESVVIEFDFGSELDAVDSASISIAPVSGTDAAVLQMVSVPHTQQGAKVLQRVGGGLNRMNYRVVCTATRGDDVRVLACVLPVRVAA